MPPEDIENRKPPDEDRVKLPDDHGNRVESSPTHTFSGVLSELDGKRKKRRRMGPPLVRMGRYYMGGVNPLVSGNPFYVQQAAEAERKERESERAAMAAQIAEEEHKRKAELWEKKAKRLFDFDNEGRFEYKLKSDPEEKRETAEDLIAQIMRLGGLANQVKASLVGNEKFPHVMVTIQEEGETVFHKGSSALLSLNFLVNKIVNRYPDDRIRLAVLPIDEEENFRQLLTEALEAFEAAQAAEAAAQPEANAPEESPESPDAKVEAAAAEPTEAAEAVAAPSKKASAKRSPPARKSPPPKKKATASKASSSKKKATKKSPTKKKR